MILTKKSLSVTLPDLPYRQTRDGNFVVRVMPVDGVVQAQSNADGLMIDRRGSDTADAGIPLASFALGKTNILVRRNPSTPGARPAYWDVPGRSVNSEMMAVVCVPWELPDDPFLRPPAIGMGTIPKALRERPILERELRIDKLPRVLSLDGAPPIERYIRFYSDFSGDAFSGWSTDTRTPDMQHPGYGTYLQCVVSQSLLWLCSKYATDAQKFALLCGMAQWGLDIGSAMADGRKNDFANGGHMLGRKATVVLLGHLLDHTLLVDPTKYLAAMGTPRPFAEDNVFQTGKWWCQPNYVLPTWRHSEDASYIERHPTTWLDSEKLRFGYIAQVVGATMGTVLAMRLMGREREFGIDACRMMDLWTHEDQMTREDLAAAGLDGVWTGTDYAVGQGAGMCLRAWREWEAMQAREQTS